MSWLKKWINWHRAPVYALGLMFCWPWFVQLADDGQLHEPLLFFIAAIYSNYFYFIFSIAKGQRLSQGISPTQAVCLFILSNILLIFMFAIGWHHFGLYGHAAQCRVDPSLLDALYFSTETFSTVGFGDFLPCNDAGKILFIAESLIATTHFGVFMTLIFSRVIFPPQHRKVHGAPPEQALATSNIQLETPLTVPNQNNPHA